ncbi:MAG: NifU family protein [Bacteroidales bacterium]|nr:NifU family protein [Bacteroidales bacterium]
MIKKVNNEIESKILSALDEIRPYLQSDGGDISFIDMNENYEVRVKLMGACGTCPMSIQTLKLGVEKAIQKAVPQVTRIFAYNEDMVDMFPEM